MKRFVFHLIGVSLAVVLLYGALVAPPGLPRTASVVAFASLILAAIVARLLDRSRVKKAARFFEYAMTGCLVVFVAATSILGGGALNGRIADGAHYLARGATETQVSAQTYFALAGFEVAFLSLVAMGLVFGIRSRTMDDHV